MKEKTSLLEPGPGEDRSQMTAERFKFRHVNEITGTFVLVVVALLIAAILWTGHSQRWFKSRVTLRIVLPEAGAGGIRQGSEVYFLGTLVGSVADVLVDDNGRMEAEANIRRDFFRFVRADSFAVVKKKFGVAGDSFFEITRGRGLPLPEKNASIICNEQDANALESAIEDIRRETLLTLNKTTAGLDAWTALGTNLLSTQERVEQLVAGLNQIISGIQQGKGTAGRLVTDPALADETQNLLARANEVMGELQGMTTNLNLAVNHIQNGTARLPEITDAVANETKDLPGLVLQTQVSMREIERLVEALQRTWLVRKYVNQINPPPLRPAPANPEVEVKPFNDARSPKDSAR